MHKDRRKPCQTIGSSTGLERAKHFIFMGQDMYPSGNKDGDDKEKTGVTATATTTLEVSISGSSSAASQPSSSSSSSSSSASQKESGSSVEEEGGSSATESGDSDDDSAGKGKAPSVAAASSSSSSHSTPVVPPLARAEITGELATLQPLFQELALWLQLENTSNKIGGFFKSEFLEKNARKVLQRIFSSQRLYLPKSEFDQFPKYVYRYLADSATHKRNRAIAELFLGTIREIHTALPGRHKAGFIEKLSHLFTDYGSLYDVKLGGLVSTQGYSPFSPDIFFNLKRHIPESLHEILSISSVLDGNFSNYLNPERLSDIASKYGLEVDFVRNMRFAFVKSYLRIDAYDQAYRNYNNLSKRVDNAIKGVVKTSAMVASSSSSSSSSVSSSSSEVLLLDLEELRLQPSVSPRKRKSSSSSSLTMSVRNAIDEVLTKINTDAGPAALQRALMTVFVTDIAAMHMLHTASSGSNPSSRLAKTMARLRAKQNQAELSQLVVALRARYKKDYSTEMQALLDTANRLHASSSSAASAERKEVDAAASVVFTELNDIETYLNSLNTQLKKAVMQVLLCLYLLDDKVAAYAGTFNGAAEHMSDAAFAEMKEKFELVKKALEADDITPVQELQEQLKGKAASSLGIIATHYTTTRDNLEQTLGQYRRAFNLRQFYAVECKLFKNRFSNYDGFITEQCRYVGDPETELPHALNVTQKELRTHKKFELPPSVYHIEAVTALVARFVQQREAIDRELAEQQTSASSSSSSSSSSSRRSRRSRRSQSKKASPQVDAGAGILAWFKKATADYRLDPYTPEQRLPKFIDSIMQASENDALEKINARLSQPRMHEMQSLVARATVSAVPRLTLSGGEQPASTKGIGVAAATAGHFSAARQNGTTHAYDDVPLPPRGDGARSPEYEAAVSTRSDTAASASSSETSSSSAAKTP